MKIDANFVKTLLAHSESNELDVKRDQYYFSKNDKEKQSEILKDILAFANSFRDEDAFILIGVDERKPPPHVIVGISYSIDDANLQQFVNNKINNAIDFLYQEIKIGQDMIGLISIPPQTGPFFVNKDFGKVKKNTVVIREGTSTKTVSPTEYSDLIRKHTRAQYIGPTSQHSYIAVEKALMGRVVHLQAFASDTADNIFDNCSELLRRGDLPAAMSDIDRIISDPEAMAALNEAQQSRAFRAKANILLRLDDLDSAEEFLLKSEAIATEEEPRVRALITLHRSGIQAALDVLGNPTTDDGRQLKAQFLLAQGKAKDALDCLPSTDPVPTHSLRPKALAQLLLNDRQGSVVTANEAVSREPEWVDAHVTAGIAKFFAATSPAYKPDQVISPDPIPQPFYRDNPSASQSLKEAEDHFRTALSKKLPESEIANIELWLLGVLALQKSRHKDAAIVLASIFAKDIANTIAILWAVSHGLDFDRDSVRERCRELLSSPDASAANVISFLALEPEPSTKSIELLAQYRHLFEADDRLDIYDHWTRRLLEETRGEDFKELADNETPSIHGLIDRATATTDWKPAMQAVADSQDDSVIMMIVAEALAFAGEWTILATLSDRLVSEVATSSSYRLAATALFNVSKDRECLKVIQDWQDQYSDESQLPVEFWRLRSMALTRLGDVTGAIQTTTSLLSQTKSREDIGRAASMHLQFGDVRSAAPFITNLIEKDELSAFEALNYSRAVQNDDQWLAGRLLEHATSKGIPPQLAAAAYEMAQRLSRNDLSDKLLGSVALAAEIPGTGVRSVTQDDAIAWFRQQRAQVQNVNNLYLRGQIPLSFACDATNDNLALRFETAFSARQSVAWTEALLIFHGSRVVPRTDLPKVQDWALCLDMTSLFVIEEIGLLPAVTDAVAAIKFPHELPGGLLELADKLAAGQPTRINRLREILDELSAGNFISDLSDPELLDRDECIRVVFNTSDATDSDPATDLHQFISEASNRGFLDQDEIRVAQSLLGPKPSHERRSTISENPTFVFDSNTIESAVSILGTKRLMEFGKCVIQADYEAEIRQECLRADLCTKALERVTRLRTTVSDGLRVNRFALLPKFAPQASSTHKINSSRDSALLSLLSQPTDEETVIAFDDRLLNRHRSTTNNPVVCTLDIIECLASSGAIDRERQAKLRQHLRDVNLYFVSPNVDDILFAVARSRTENEIIVETPRLKAIRRYVARLHSLQEYLDFEPSQGAPNEIALALAVFRLPAQAIEALWADGSLTEEDVQSRSTWIWQSIHTPVLERLPLNNRTTASIRYLLAVQMCSLLISALANSMTSKRTDPEGWMKLQIGWIWSVCIEPYLDGNRTLLKEIAEHLRQFVTPMADNVLEEVAEHDRLDALELTRAYVARFLVALPDRLKRCTLEDEDFGVKFGIQVQTIAEVAGVSMDDGVLREAMLNATTSRTPQTFATQAGDATVEIAYRGSKRRPPVARITGAISVSYQEPILGLLGKDRTSRFTIFAEQSNWFDLSKEQLSELTRNSRNMSNMCFFAVVDELRRNSAPYHYEMLGTSMSEGSPLSQRDFDAPNPESLLQMLRLPRQSRKRFSFVVDRSAVSLIDQYGVEQAFDRLSMLPIDLVNRFVDPVIELINQKPRKTKAWLLSQAGSALQRINRIALAAAISSHGLIDIRSVRSSLRILLSDWQADAELLVQVLKTTDQLLSNLDSVTELQPEMRLACVWTHSGHIVAITRAHVERASSATEYFKNISGSSLAGILKMYSDYETDVAVPELICPPVLLHYGMSHVFRQNDKVFTVPLLKVLGEQQRLTDAPTSPLSPRLLQMRVHATDSLDSYLGQIDPRFEEIFNKANQNNAIPSTWFDERRFEVNLGQTLNPQDSLFWTEILAHEQRWLDSSTRSKILATILAIDWEAFCSESESAAVCTFMVITEMISYLPSENEAKNLIQQLLINCTLASAPSATELRGSDNNEHLSFAFMLAEGAYRAARSRDMGRSCRILASGLGTLANQQDVYQARMLEILDMLIPMLPVEHVEPLVLLRRSLRCNS